MMLMVFQHGYIIKHYFDNSLTNSQWDNNVKVYCCSYGKQFNLGWFKDRSQEFIEQYGQNIQIYMLDYAIQPNSDMIKFYNWCKLKDVEFFWIDHHITAIQNIGHDTIPGFVDDKFCGAVNTWLNIMQQKQTIQQAPKILKIVNDMDTWNKQSKFSWDSQIWPVTYYLNSLGTDLNDNDGELVKFLKDAFDDDQCLDGALNVGRFIAKYVKSLEKQNLRKIYNKQWNGYNCLVLNTTVPGSMQFEQHPDFNNVDLLLTWSYDGKYYYYGAYTTKPNIDVGQLCQTFFNGGGHKGCGGGMLKQFVL